MSNELNELTAGAAAEVQAGMVRYQQAQDEIIRLKQALFDAIKDRELLSVELDSRGRELHDVKQERDRVRAECIADIERYRLERDNAILKCASIETQILVFTQQMGAVKDQLEKFCERMHFSPPTVKTVTETKPAVDHAAELAKRLE